MSVHTTTTKPCVRFVLVRNAQCRKHLTQQDGDFDLSDPGSPDVLTGEGDKMALSLSCLVEYLEARPYSGDSQHTPNRNYNLLIDKSGIQHYETAKYMKQENPNIKTHYIDNINSLHR